MTWVNGKQHAQIAHANQFGWFVLVFLIKEHSASVNENAFLIGFPHFNVRPLVCSGLTLPGDKEFNLDKSHQSACVSVT